MSSWADAEELEAARLAPLFDEWAQSFMAGDDPSPKIGDEIFDVAGRYFGYDETAAGKVVYRLMGERAIKNAVAFQKQEAITVL
jgi:hypothetical protein